MHSLAHMESTSSATRLHRSIIDESFDIASANQYGCYLQLNVNFLTVAIADISRKKFIALEDFRFDSTSGVEMLAHTCEAIKQQSQLLSAENYRETNCCVNFNTSTLIPEPLYEKESERLMTEFNFSDLNQPVFFTDDLKMIGAKNLFTVPALIEKMLNYWFRNVRLHHHSTVFIKNSLLLNKNNTEKNASINIRVEEFDMMVTAANKLIFYNSFIFKTNEDFLYFVLFTLEQLQLNPETIEVTLTGETDKYSPQYTGLMKHVRHVSLGERSEAHSFSYKFDSLQATAYSLLFNQHLCEL